MTHHDHDDSGVCTDCSPDSGRLVAALGYLAIVCGLALVMGALVRACGVQP